MRNRLTVLIAFALALTVAPIFAQGLQKEAIEGIRNYTRVDATIGCAGATEVQAIPELARRGYKTIINLRQDTENGANIEESRQAAVAAHVKFVHLPFNGQAPDPKVVDEFIAAVTDTANQPVFINCGSANRVGALWMAKRMLVDGWPEDRAAEEATTIGLSSAALRQFAIDYVTVRRRS
jgi:uncharacterized protein (TIGR01244 family)